MQLLSFPVLLSIIPGILIALFCGIIKAKNDPKRSAALFAASIIVDGGGSQLTPAQVSTILLPDATRTTSTLSITGAIVIGILALLTSWWIILITLPISFIATYIIERRFTDYRLLPNLELLIENQQIRLEKYRQQNDPDRAEWTTKYISQLEGMREGAEEIFLPSWSEQAKRVGLKRSL